MPILQKMLAKRRMKEFSKAMIKNMTISLSAQAFTAPIVIYNFKSFPILFLLTNVIVIPFLGFILVSVILLIVFVEIGFLNSVLSFIVDVELNFLVAIAKFIESLTNAIVT
jgi:competence protein ComEC